MKIWGMFVLLLGAGCAAPPRPAPPLPADSRDSVDRLRVETAWHPAPTGGDCVMAWYELPQGAYVAQGWGWNACFSPERPICWRRREFTPRR